MCMCMHVCVNTLSVKASWCYETSWPVGQASEWFGTSGAHAGVISSTSWSQIINLQNETVCTYENIDTKITVI